jgi:PST family polysaccharide transporter/lipopolysaccharide exporter
MKPKKNELRNKSLQGAFWLGSLRVIIKAFAFFKLLVIARILSPHDLGLFGIMLLPYGFLEVALESGMNQALIQTKKSPQRYLGTAWVTLILRGSVIALALFLLAGPVSRFYDTDLVLPIRILALTPFLKGLINPAVVLFRKNLKYVKEFTYQSIASVAESLGTILLTLYLKDVLALPLGVVVGGLTALIVSWLMVRPSFARVSWNRFKELYGYGKWVTVGTFMSWLNDQGDDFLVSKVLGPQSLGLYQTAYKISNLPTTEGAGLIYQIIFPIFATIQNDMVRLKRGLIKALTLTFSLSLLFALFVYLSAPFLVGWLLGEAWLPMVPALNVLLLFGISRPLISVSSALFDAVGKPQIATYMNLIKLTTLVLLVWPLTHYFGIVGTAWAVVAAQLAAYPWYFKRLSSYFKPVTRS